MASETAAWSLTLKSASSHQIPGVVLQDGNCTITLRGSRNDTDLEIQLIQDLPSLEALQELTIEDCEGLTDLKWGSEIFCNQITALQELHITQCEVRVLQNFGHITSIRTLSIDECGVEHGSESPSTSLEKFTNLHQLNWSQSDMYDSAIQHYHELPECIERMVELHTLNLSTIGFSVLPSWIGNLTMLRILNLCTLTDLTKLPDSICSLSGLHVLTIYNCGSLGSLPTSIGSLASLATMTLHGLGQLTKLPSSMQYLTGLTELNITHCSTAIFEGMNPWANFNSFYRFKQVPDMGLLQSLQKMTLHNLPFVMAMPESLSSLSGLNVLSLYNIGLTELQQVGTLMSLQVLHIRYCALQRLPESVGGLTRLKELHIEHCNLDDLPASIQFLTSISKLVLVVPRDIQNCQVFKTLASALPAFRLLQCMRVQCVPRSTTVVLQRKAWVCIVSSLIQNSQQLFLLFLDVLLFICISFLLPS